MQCVANYEVNSEVSLVSDSLRLKIQHPKGAFRARLQNIVREDYSTPFLLSLHIYFDAPTLKDAKPIAEEKLVECLNLFAFAIGARFRRHRIRQIVDCTPTSGMRELLFWADSIENEDPQPFLDNEFVKTIERLLQFEPPPAIRRALRWYRLGILATVPEDQFQNFWFALEIIAEFQKSSEEVPSKCPHCKASLYCETCKTHPTHRPFPIQAIRALIQKVDKECTEDTLAALEKARHAVMHGAILDEVSLKLPNPDDHVVDVLGRILFRALVFQFPHEYFDGTIKMAAPSTYVHRTLTAVAHMSTVIPMDAQGDLDLSLSGFKAEVVTDGGPQSALPTVLAMTQDQHERMGRLSHKKGDHQEFCRRVYQRVKPGKDGKILALVLATDFARVEEALRRGESGEWQDLFREIIGRDVPKVEDHH